MTPTNETTERTTARQAILEAVVTCIEKYGISQLTTRKIAEEAGVNIAAINYYFGTKDELIAETLSMTITHMLEDVVAEIDTPRPFAESLQAVFFYLIDGAYRFPGITLAHLYDAVVQKRYDAPSALVFDQVYRRMIARAQAEHPQREADAVQLAVAQVMSSILLTMLAPGLLPLGAAYSLETEAGRRALAESYVEMLLRAL
jgi:AcrR family transcriptional regulator